MNKTVTAIILVAGNSTRFGQNRNKNFENIDDRKLQLADLNNDKIPECIIMGSKSGVGYIAKVYSIGKNKKAQMLKELNMTNLKTVTYDGVAILQ